MLFRFKSLGVLSKREKNCWITSSFGIMLSLFLSKFAWSLQSNQITLIQFILWADICATGDWIWNIMFDLKGMIWNFSMRMLKFALNFFHPRENSTQYSLSSKIQTKFQCSMAQLLRHLHLRGWVIRQKFTEILFTSGVKANLIIQSLKTSWKRGFPNSLHSGEV